MKLRIRGGEDGQALAQTAITMMLLLAIVSLAIDVGLAYAERRHMQNAADAGALAGAWELCFGDPAQWQSTALDYAINRNGAETAEAYYNDGWIVQVIARQNVQTFLAGIIGISTVEVAAVAEAGCGNAGSACSVWPLAFHIDRFPLPDDANLPEDVNCDEEFYVFDDDRLEADPDDTCPISWKGECYGICDPHPVPGGETLPPLCDCSTIPNTPPPDNERLVLHSGDRGWVRMPKTDVEGTPYEDQVPCDPSNCGSSALKCWLEFGGYIPPIPLPRGENDEGLGCFRDNPGVIGAVEKPIDRFIDANPEGNRVNILIWDTDCETGGYDLPEGWEFCPGPADRNYHVVGLGCVEILDYEKKFDIPLNDDPELGLGSGLCIKNVKVIHAVRRCDCESECGIASGPPVPGGVNAVSLLR